MAFLNQILRWISRLSLDVVAGALSGLLFFSRLFRVQIDPIVYLLLGTAVWCIYTTDHILDSKKGNDPVPERYAFHAKYGKFLGLLVGILAIQGVLLAYRFLGLGIEFYLSLGLVLVIGLTMVMVRKAGSTGGLIKEFSTALFYVLGISWLPMLRMPAVEWSGFHFLFLGLYVGLAFLNLLMLSVLDRKEDQSQGFGSAALLFDPVILISWIRKGLIWLIFLALGVFIFLPSFYRPFACMLLLMLLVHYFTFFSNHLSIDHKRRQMEAAFLIPALLIVL